MPKISRKEYTSAERKRHDAGYYRMLDIIRSDEPDAGKFRRTLDEELASGLPINWPDDFDNTLLHWAASCSGAVCAGLPQILIGAGADVDAKDDKGSTPLGDSCWNYVYNGEPDRLSAVDALLEAGAKPELDESWKKYSENAAWRKPEQRERRKWLGAYIAAWTERRAAQDRDEDASPAFDYAI